MLKLGVWYCQIRYHFHRYPLLQARVELLGHTQMKNGVTFQLAFPLPLAYGRLRETRWDMEVEQGCSLEEVGVFRAGSFSFSMQNSLHQRHSECSRYQM